MQQRKLLEQRPELFDERAQAGRIIEAHGDLRPEHICLEAEPQIIDCLEFSRELRILDPADELAFLALECERLGAPAFAATIFETYTEDHGRCAASAPARLLSKLSRLRARKARDLASQRSGAARAVQMGGACARLSAARQPAWRTHRVNPGMQSVDSVAEQLHDRAIAVQPADRLREQARGADLDESRLQARRGHTQWRDRVRHNDPLNLARGEHGVGRFRENAVRSDREHTRRAALAACVRGARDRIAGADQVVDDDGRLAADVTDERFAGEDAAAAILLGKRRGNRTLERRPTSAVRNASARLMPPASGETTASSSAPTSGTSSVNEKRRGLEMLGATAKRVLKGGQIVHVQRHDTIGPDGFEQRRDVARGHRIARP